MIIKGSARYDVDEILGLDVSVPGVTGVFFGSLSTEPVQWGVAQYSEQNFELILKALRDLTRQVASLEKKVDALSAPDHAPHDVVRTITPEEAKKELTSWFHENPGRYPSDAAEHLNLDPWFVKTICDELNVEGLLEPAE